MNPISPDNLYPKSGFMRKRLICSNIIKNCGFLSAEFSVGDNDDLYYFVDNHIFHFHFDIDGFLVRMEMECDNGR